MIGDLLRARCYDNVVTEQIVELGEKKIAYPVRTDLAAEDVVCCYSAHD